MPRPTSAPQRKSIPPIESLCRTTFGRGSACGRGQVAKRVLPRTGRGDCGQPGITWRTPARRWPVARESRLVYEFASATPAAGWHSHARLVGSARVPTQYNLWSGQCLRPWSSDEACPAAHWPGRLRSNCDHVGGCLRAAGQCHTVQELFVRIEKQKDPSDVLGSGQNRELSPGLPHDGSAATDGPAGLAGG